MVILLVCVSTLKFKCVHKSWQKRGCSKLCLLQILRKERSMYIYALGRPWDCDAIEIHTSAFSKVIAHTVYMTSTKVPTLAAVA